MISIKNNDIYWILIRKLNCRLKYLKTYKQWHAHTGTGVEGIKPVPHFIW